MHKTLRKGKWMNKTTLFIGLSCLLIAIPAFANFSHTASISASVQIQRKLLLSFPEGRALPPLVIDTGASSSGSFKTASIPYCVYSNASLSSAYRMTVSGSLQGGSLSQGAILPYKLKVKDGVGIENSYHVEGDTVVMKANQSLKASSFLGCPADSGPNAKGSIVLEVEEQTWRTALADTYTGNIYLTVQEV